MKKLLAVLAFVAVVLMVVVPNVCADGVCEFAYKDDDLADSVTESVYQSDTHVACKVVVKAATQLFEFTEDGCDRCYCAEGLGTGYAKVYENFVRDCVCHDMSHADWYEKEKPTAVTFTMVEAKADPVILLAVSAVCLVAAIATLAFVRGRNKGFVAGSDAQSEFEERIDN